MADPIIKQIRNSILSKQGQTSTTGVFESQPENALNSRRGYTVPISDQQRIPPIIDATFTSKWILHSNNNTMTYLDSLKAAKKI